VERAGWLDLGFLNVEGGFQIDRHDNEESI